MRGVPPNTDSQRGLPGQPGAGGSASTTQLISAANPSAPKPAHTTRRARA